MLGYRSVWVVVGGMWKVVVGPEGWGSRHAVPPESIHIFNLLVDPWCQHHASSSFFKDSHRTKPRRKLYGGGLRTRKEKAVPRA